MGTGAQAVAGLVVAGIGVVGIAARYRPIAAFAYPIVWWGLLAAVDALNAARSGRSPMRANWKHFLGVTVPLSVLFWLVYEYLNLAFPQWRYTGDLTGTATQVLFGFVSFATVIPILVEFQWLAGGPTTRWCSGDRLGERVKRWRLALVGCGAALIAAPVFSDLFWLNQGAWLAPALVLLPFVVGSGNPGGIRPRRLAGSTVFAALIGGFLWELINYWSLTKWQYTIHPDWPRLFEMPLLGYLGFVPFAFGTVAVYAVHLRLRARPAVVMALYLSALAAMYALVLLYRDRGYWVEVAYRQTMSGRYT